ncbi:hypothetical protein M5D96_009304 [Drosophila gunungcola]|uniref:Uncharacterized protein n=1 Tax=Drosophila gunungcola TaxID=103775 RepID=A0A9P9YIX4_9MUSC|nr:hypothetical protein M5D96_009304 [Drosophila gunungcola]
MESQGSHDQGRNVILERQERVSIQAQVRELYRHQSVKVPGSAPKQHSSVSSDLEKIQRTRQKVNSLNRKIEHEIENLKRLRKYFLESKETRCKSGSQEMASVKDMTWGQSLEANQAKENSKSELGGRTAVATNPTYTRMPVKEAVKTETIKPEDTDRVNSSQEPDEFDHNQCSEWQDEYETQQNSLDMRQHDISFNDPNTEYTSFPDQIPSRCVRTSSEFDRYGKERSDRSSSSAEHTCIESTCDDDFASCDEPDPQVDFKRIPPFDACPCMYQTYVNLAAMCQGRFVQ